MTLLPDHLTPVPLPDLLVALATGYRRSLGSDPVSAAQLACLGAQLALESGNGLKAHCFNFGNRKAREDDAFSCSYRCDEIFNEPTMRAAVKLGPCDALHWPDAPDGTKRFRVVLPAGHPWAMFAAFQTAEDGARDYCDLLSGKAPFAAAWSRAYRGLATEFSHELHRAGYYTADVETYTRGLVSIADRIRPACARILGGADHGITDQDRIDVGYLVAAFLAATIAAGPDTVSDTEPAPAPEPNV